MHKDPMAAANKGAQMRVLFDNPLFDEALHALRMNIYHRWAKTTPGAKHTEDREELHRLYQASVILEGQFRSYIGEGEDAVEFMKETAKLNDGAFNA